VKKVCINDKLKLTSEQEKMFRKIFGKGKPFLTKFDENIGKQFAEMTGYGRPEEWDDLWGVIGNQLDNLMEHYEAEKEEREAVELLWEEKRKSQEEVKRLLGLPPTKKTFNFKKSVNRNADQQRYFAAVR
jgi:phosphoglycolate phosphatase-like HAD superfamily hydrolase